MRSRPHQFPPKFPSLLQLAAPSLLARWAQSRQLPLPYPLHRVAFSLSLAYGKSSKERQQTLYLNVESTMLSLRQFLPGIPFWLQRAIGSARCRRTSSLRPACCIR